jgi:putative transposase
MSTRKSRASCARDVALFRYSLIRPLADPVLTAAERGVLVRELARGVHVGPAGEAVRVSRSTLDRWVRAWRVGGFDALVPPVRQVHPRTVAEALELAAGLKRERPARTAAHIARIVEASQGWAPSARTLQRHFVRLELGRRPDGTAPGVFGRFEAEAPNVRWVTDGLHGPLVDGRRAVLFALLDDHSRFVVGHRWGFGEDTLGMQAALHDAVKTHGCPSYLYCDNGSAYSSGQLAWSAAVLDIQITHSRPGRPEGRGKIERWNRTCRDQFLVEIEVANTGGGSTCSSLADLNRLFTAWLHQRYHRARHSETGQSPAQRYHSAAPAPRRPGPDQLRRAFLWREQRTVSAVATVALHGNRYEVDASLTGRKVDLLFNPFDLTRIEVEYQARPMGDAIPHRVKRHVHPDVKPHAPAPVQATGIDYLRLIEAAHQANIGQAINFAALADGEATRDARADTGEDGENGEQDR